jgi:plasmid stability protein
MISEQRLIIGETAMPDILVRGLNAKTVKQLKARAKQHGRSLQGEARLLLERSAGADAAEVAEMLGKWKKKFAGRKLASSVDLIREDRSR